ncbi:hypothetical protein Tco_0925768 [Tanacetum coccineum]|uniref:Uncharacterized protein n=1 Tax=Tanacetum coccineum TaxID=301880 RepID=A0ABQ5DEU7_9ASTR
MRRCVGGNEILKILAHCHSGPTEGAGHHQCINLRKESFEWPGFYWPSIFKDAKDYVCEVFDVWGLDFMGPFLDYRIEHKAYCALKYCNMDLTAVTKNCFMELNELMELRDGAYENTRIYRNEQETGNCILRT